MSDKVALTSELQAVRDDLARTKDVLGTLISWIAQSAKGIRGPVSIEEANELLKRLIVK